jgi:hypothetical protein
MSGRLVKVQDGQLLIAHLYVAAPGYQLTTAQATSAHGWTYYADDLDREDFAEPWRQPIGEEDAYALGAIVSHNNKSWRSLLNVNVWEPGVSGWREATDDFAAWIQPTGSHDAYAEGEIVTHNGKIWRSLIGANTGEPGVSGWRESVLMPPGDEPVTYPAWIKPTGAHDAYQIGDRVTHVEKNWESTINANTTEPGTLTEWGYWVEI